MQYAFLIRQARNQHIYIVHESIISYCFQTPRDCALGWQRWRWPQSEKAPGAAKAYASTTNSANHNWHVRQVFNAEAI